MAKKICLFNHKGGVSKTTTCFNIGWKLASMGHKTLLIDADPQCNLTGLIMGDDDFEQYYLNHPSDNFMGGVAPAFESVPTPLVANNAVIVPGNQNLFLVPGHINLSEYDVSLSIAHQLSNTIPTLKNLPGAINHFIDLMAAKYNVEFVLIDMNPSLSAINQNLFCISDYFLIPTSPDFFSVMAVRSLAQVLPRWENWGRGARTTFRNTTYPFPSQVPKFLGTIIQNYAIRKGNPSAAFQNWVDNVGAEVITSLIPALTTEAMLLPAHIYTASQLASNYTLVKIPDFQGLLPKSQELRIPVYALSDSALGTGKILEQYQPMRERFDNIFIDFSNDIINMTR